MTHTIYYTRCPVATASGLAYQRGSFGEAFAGTGYEVRNLKELGRGKAGTHFTHKIPNSIREGGAIPPLWARVRGADTVVIGLTFTPECLSFYVRPGEGEGGFAGLRGRRLGLPRRPQLEVDFMRVNAHKAFSGALAEHGMSASDVEFTDVVIDEDVLAIANVDYGQGSERKVPPLYAGEIEALLRGEADCVFAKNAETKYLEQVYGDRIEKVYDLLDCAHVEHKINANPRIITASGELAREHPDAVVNYLRVLVRTAAWASDHPREAAETMAVELGVQTEDIVASYEAAFHTQLWPTLSQEMRALLQNQIEFMVKHDYLPPGVSLDGWAQEDLLRRAYELEGIDYAGKALPWAA